MISWLISGNLHLLSAAITAVFLDAVKHNILYVPEGMAHGFLALENSVFVYKCTQFYHKESERGILWNDPQLGIEWGVSDPIVSEKDKALPLFQEVMEKL